MTDLLDVPELDALMVALCEAHPDRINPRVGDTCVYRFECPDDTIRHCLVGQFVTDREWGLPRCNPPASLAALDLRWPVTPAAASRLGEWQAWADEWDVAWGSVPARLGVVGGV